MSLLFALIALGAWLGGPRMAGSDSDETDVAARRRGSRAERAFPDAPR